MTRAELTINRLLAIWWAYAWRYLIIYIPGGLVVGITAYAITASVADDETARGVDALCAYLAIIPASISAFHWALWKELQQSKLRLTGDAIPADIDQTRALTFERTLAIIWAWAWRASAVTIPAVLLLVPLAILVFASSAPVDRQDGRVIGQVLGFLAAIPASLWALRAALTKKYDGFQIDMGIGTSNPPLSASARLAERRKRSRPKQRAD
jgi:hypothetical protein